MTSERALEILAAYGSDPARWPEDERAVCLAHVARNPALARARREAAVLDAALTSWARTPLTTASAATEAAVVRAGVAIGATRTLEWPARTWRTVAGAGLAASVAAALFVGAPKDAPAPVPTRAVPTVALAQTTDSEAFRQVFTPTPDEEEVL